MKVLYADGDAEIRDYVSMLLEAGHDCDVLEASSGNEALLILEYDSDVDFIISEVNMSGGSGSLIVDYLDENEINIPIIWISDSDNKNSPFVKNVLERSDVNGFVPKPFRDDQFFPVVDKILAEKGKKIDAKGSQNSESDNSDIEEDSFLDPTELEAYEGESHDNNDDEWDDLLNPSEENIADWSLKKEYKYTEGTINYKKEQKQNNDNAPILAKAENESLIHKHSENKKKKPIREIDKLETYDKKRFRRIKLKRFYNFSLVCCDVYIKLSEKKYVKIINAQEKYDGPIIEKYEQKGQKYFFIEKEYYEDFQAQFGDLVLQKLDKAQDLPSDVKVLAELASFEHTQKLVNEFGVTNRTSDFVKKSIASNLNTLKELPDFKLLLERIMRGGDYISEHSLMLCYFAGQICLATGWGNNSAVERLSMAALLHDSTLNDEKLARVHSLEDAISKGLSTDEIEAIQRHPMEAASLVLEGEKVFSDVDSIIMQHHELPDQSGFPKGLGALSISPLSCVFIIASEFTERIYGQNPDDIDMESIKTDFKNKYNRGNFKKPLEAFLKVF